MQAFYQMMVLWSHKNSPRYSKENYLTWLLLSLCSSLDRSAVLALRCCVTWDSWPWLAVMWKENCFPLHRARPIVRNGWLCSISSYGEFGIILTFWVLCTHTISSGIWRRKVSWKQLGTLPLVSANLSVLCPSCVKYHRSKQPSEDGCGTAVGCNTWCQRVCVAAFGKGMVPFLWSITEQHSSCWGLIIRSVQSD